MYFDEKVVAVVAAVCTAEGDVDLDDLPAEEGGLEVDDTPVRLVIGREDDTDAACGRALFAKEEEDVLLIPCCRLCFSGDAGGVGTSTTRETR